MPCISGFKIPTAAADAAAAALPYCFLFWENRAHALQMDYTYFYYNEEQEENVDERDGHFYLTNKKRFEIFLFAFLPFQYASMCCVLYTEFFGCYRKLFHMLFDGNVQCVL